MKFKSGIKIALGAIVITTILGYAYSKTESFLRGPTIDVTTPQSGSSVHQQITVIEGTIERAAHITLNGRQIYTDEAGVLKEEVLLAEGYNVLELSARDRFGRETREIIEIVYNQSLQF
ncbi:hypothetical protein CL630_03715 [bacterium]|nr:hypothetical protein [bacterium]|tara:strand:- start:5538 stop:5894 length:357 start_codon:yes stop_codon:yes gene_type:complete